MVEFYNPYHFVPVTSEGRAQDLPVAKFCSGETGHVRHDLYAPLTDNFFSGRLLCRLVIEEPTVIGGEHKPENPTRVYPFEIGEKPAIPASTLKGLISSIAEAASNSALRVLEDRGLSYRVPANEEPLSAIGMVIEAQGPDGKPEWRLRPLALPTMKIERGGGAVLPDCYGKMFPQDRNPPPLKVFINDDKRLNTYSIERPAYYYARLSPPLWGPGHILALDNHLHLSGNRSYLLAQDTAGNSHPIPEHELPGFEEERKLYTRGILRILGVQDRDMPPTKKHELFIPYSEEDEKRETFIIPPEVVDRFHRMADERTEAQDKAPFLPYEPRGTQRNLHLVDKDDHTFRLKHGDLVYFRPTPNGDAVAEIALSSMWRRWAGNVHMHFGKISSEKLPFHSGRTSISMAEQLFGFVEEKGERAHRHEDHGVLALAGRLRFSFGLLASKQNEPYYGDWTLLKILGSPKPPQPALYFKYVRGKTQRIQVGSLLSSNQYLPQGRKFYLHRNPQDIAPWKTHYEGENLNQKSCVRPLKPNLSFYFHVDFDNLSQMELGMLCYAIRPGDAFRHKIGMGKPIGLGRVRIDPIGIFLVNRSERYKETDIFNATRYHHVWVSPGEPVNKWPETYLREGREAGITKLKNHGYTFDAFRGAFSVTMNGDIKHALELLGDPAKVRKHPVHTPQVAGKDLEKETYSWFVENQHTRNKQQRLEPLNPDSPALPTLNTRWEPSGPK